MNPKNSIIEGKYCITFDYNILLYKYNTYDDTAFQDEYSNNSNLDDSSIMLIYFISKYIISNQFNE